MWNRQGVCTFFLRLSSFKQASFNSLFHVLGISTFSDSDESEWLLELSLWFILEPELPSKKLLEGEPNVEQVFVGNDKLCSDLFFFIFYSKILDIWSFVPSPEHRQGFVHPKMKIPNPYCLFYFLEHKIN